VGLTQCSVLGSVTCVDLQTDNAHCGSCPNVCESGEVCSGGGCHLTCTLDTPDICDGICVDADTDPNHCGLTCAQCAVGGVCNSGACGCPSGQTDCSGTCKSTSFDPLFCGATCTTCPTPTNATPVCVGGTCSGVCQSGAVDCNNDMANGCEAILATDPLSCGGCGISCNDGSTCTTDLCASGTCSHAGAFAAHPWWNVAWQYRAPGMIPNSFALPIPIGYTVSLAFDHQAIVAAGHSLANGNDIRVVYFDGSTAHELDRVLAPNSAWNTANTTIMFSAGEAIPPSATSDAYRIYYGNAPASAPPAVLSLATSTLSGWAVETTDGQTLISERIDNTFYTIQLRQISADQFEVHIYDYTADSAAYGRIAVVDTSTSAVLWDKTYGSYGTFGSGGTFDETITISANSFSVYLEGREYSGVWLRFGSVGSYFGYVSPPAYGAGNTTRFYSRSAPLGAQPVGSLASCYETRP
jgi:hypothetical protein